MARNVTISTLTFPRHYSKPPNTPAHALFEMGKWIDRAAHDKPDVIVLPEVASMLGCCSGDLRVLGEPVPGPTVDLLAKKASAHNAYIVCGMLQSEGDRVYNAAVTIDRQGNVASVYHKNRPTIGEMDNHVTPGTEVPVFEADWGKYACLICFDLNFRELWEPIRKGKADVIFFPSMFRGGLQMRILAYETGAFAVSSTPEEGSVVVNRCGEIVGESSMYETIVTRTINLDSAVVHIDYNHPRVEKANAKYGRDLQVNVYSPEAIMLLTWRGTNGTIHDVIKEFDIEPIEDYWDRSRKRCEQALASK